ncbi:MAG: hypothetical protein ILO68_02485 [Clostridia bacterium]|nr:hypothetical protein [Clostridia bacterium]
MRPERGPNGKKHTAKRFVRTCAALAAAALVFAAQAVCAFAYSSPFAPAKSATPGEANQAAEVRYELRGGGTFLYQNNPERIFADNIGKALMIENDLHGDVYFTSENCNKTGERVLFGLQLRNRSGSDVTVTVKNIGWQSGIDWFGQKEWTDFFQVAYELEPGEGGHAFPSVFQPVPFRETTYVIPDGEYFYVAGGSSEDAYGNISVGGTADVYIEKGKLINAAVYFRVDGPETGVSAAYVCYRSGKNPVRSEQQQGYVVSRNGESFGRQYLGSAPYLCAEASIAWNIDDRFASGRNLPVRYTVTYYQNTASGAYGEYSGLRTRTVSSDVWKTHLNPQSDSSYIGTDMMPFHCVTEDGREVVIDTKHNDGTGKPANIGNWMVIYEESLTVRNSGTRLRKFTVDMRNNGITALHVKDGSRGLLRAVYHFNKGDVYTFYVRPGETRTICLEYVLLADSFGSQEHRVRAEDVSAEEEASLRGTLSGDVNDDRKVNATDYLLLKRFVLGTATPKEVQRFRMDISGDGKVNASDYLRLKRTVLGS